MASVGRHSAASSGRSDQAEPAEFSRELERYHVWRDRIAAAVGDYRLWAEQHGFVSPETDLRLSVVINQLKVDKVQVVLVSEFSRGKTELINALFFSSTAQRLLPSAPGRTTMCTTELRYDEDEPLGLRLLPIETRRTHLTIAEYKRTPAHWTVHHLLKPNSLDELREAVNEITRTKRISAREAQELGLYRPDEHGARASVAEMVEVPVWRHAVINYPHELLRRGLVVLDTPGLNAIGAEPELTYQMVPEAHVALFILSADTGVTQSDFEIWSRHVAPGSGAAPVGRYVVLNRIDILWDELKDASQVAAAVARQVDETAQTLGIDTARVFPVSAQKGYAARVKGDKALLERSGLPGLEDAIVRDILSSRFDLVRTKIARDIGERVRQARALLETRLRGFERQLADLRSLGGRNTDAVQKMFERLRTEQQRYDRELAGFELTRRALAAEGRDLLAPLKLQELDALIDVARQEMESSWTTQGLRSAMAGLFADISQRVDRVGEEAERLKKNVNTLYERLHREHGFSKLPPPALSFVHYLLECTRLQKRAELFRTSPAMVITEQRFVIRNFFGTVVRQTRELLVECREAATAWLMAVLSPAIEQLCEHRGQIQRQLDMLRKVRRNMDLLAGQIAELEASRADIEHQLQFLDSLLLRLDGDDRLPK